MTVTKRDANLCFYVRVGTLKGPITEPMKIKVNIVTKIVAKA